MTMVAGQPPPAPTATPPATPPPAPGQGPAAGARPRPAGPTVERAPWWIQHPAGLTIGALALVLMGLILYRRFGWLGVAVAAAVLLLVALPIIGARRRSARRPGAGPARRPGGVRPAGPGGRFGPRSRGRILGGGHGGLRGGLGRIFGRGGGRTAAGRGGPPAGRVGRGGGLGRILRRPGQGGRARGGRPGRGGGPLGRVFGRGRPAGAGTSPAGRGRGPLGRVFGRGRPGGPATTPRPAGARGRGPLGRIFGGNRPATGRGGMTGGPPPHRGGSRSPFGRLFGRRGGNRPTLGGNRPTGRGGNRAAAGRGGPAGHPPPHRAGQPTQPATLLGRLKAAKTFWFAKPTPAVPPPGNVTTVRRPAGTPKAGAPTPGASGSAPQRPTRPSRPPTPQPSARPATGGPAMTNPSGNGHSGIKYRDDASMQGFGRNVLPQVGHAAHGVADTHASTAGNGQAFVDALTRLNTQAQHDLPTSGPLKAEMEAMVAEARRLHAAEMDNAAAWRRLAVRADALPGMYSATHRGDNDRVDSPRGGSRGVEARADVQSANRDV